MITEQSVKNLIKDLHETTTADMDDRTIKDVLAALEESGETPAPVRPKIWRIILKSRMAKLVAAAVIIVAVTSALRHHTGSVDLATTALAQALENMQNVPWIRVKMFKADEDGEEGDELWTGLASQVVLLKRTTGEIEYLDLASRTQFKYHPISKVATISYLQNHIEPLDIILFRFTSVDEVKKRFNDGTEIEMTRRQHKGKMVHVFNCVTVTDMAFVDTDVKPKLIVRQEWIVDPQTHLPIEGKLSLKEWDRVFEFEYPDDGPRSIYDLGLPPSISIPTDLLELVQGYHTYKKNVPDKYIALVTTSSSESNEGKFESVRIIFRDGHLMRTEYREAKEHDAWQDYSSQMGLTFDSLYSWWANNENSEITDVYLYDGKHDCYVSLSDPGENYQIAGRDPNHAGLDEMGWPDIRTQFGPGKETRIVETAYSRDNGLLGIEVLSRGKVDTTGKRVTLPERVLCYLDPTRDYICQRMERESMFAASWDQDQTWLDAVDVNDIPPNSTVISEVLECAQTDTGRWYPKIIRSLVLEDEQETQESVLTIWVGTNPKFPKGAFDRKAWP